MTDEPAHRFRVGQDVSLNAGYGYTRSINVPFKITALLPSNGFQYQYRIRNSSENFERVAAENELTARQTH